ncbi:MAG: hypothetical protein K2H43_05400, partial [Clostridia bacterium]|nr:hypothetical protein [Clostridia bacterium]
MKVKSLAGMIAGVIALSGVAPLCTLGKTKENLTYEVVWNTDIASDSSQNDFASAANNAAEQPITRISSS